MSYLKYLYVPKLSAKYFTEPCNLKHFLNYVAFKEDYFNKIDWKKELLSCIKLYETPQNIYIGDIYKNYYN